MACRLPTPPTAPSSSRPVLSILGPADSAAFVAEYSERIRAIYPAAGYGTVLPFRRVFVVARRS